MNTEGIIFMYLTQKQIEERLDYFKENYPGRNWKYSEKYRCVVSDAGEIGFINPNRGKDFYARYIQNNGYVSFKNTTEHKVVWETFNGDVPEGLEIDHIDEDKTNNRLDNLQLLSHYYNLLKRDRNGNALNIAINQYDLDGNLIKSWKSSAEAAREMAKAYKEDICIALKTGKPYKGFIWKKKDLLNDPNSDIL